MGHHGGVSILIDPPSVPWRGRMWSHVASDESFEELHAFAAALGVPRRGFDRDHYDVPAEYYDAIVAAGAMPRDRRPVAGLRSAAPEVANYSVTSSSDLTSAATFLLAGASHSRRAWTVWNRVGLRNRSRSTAARPRRKSGSGTAAYSCRTPAT